MASQCVQAAVPRKPIPHYIDSITKKLKYVDPAHRYCVPGFKAADFTPKNKKDKYNGRTHNCMADVQTNSGERYACCHPQILTGFKAPNAYSRTPLFDGLTTNNYFSTKVRKVGEEVGNWRSYGYENTFNHSQEISCSSKEQDWLE